MPEDPLVVSISSGSSVGPDEMRSKTFPLVKRGGVDADAVRRYLEVVAAELKALHEREADLRRRLSDAERRAAEPELDETTLTRAVGAETARILQTAHGAARDVVERAERQAAELLAEAEQAAEARTAAAEEAAEARTAEAEEAASALLAAAESEAATLTETAREDAEALLEATKDECRSMVHEARRLRTGVLQDLNERRKALFVQLEQLRSGRDSLVDVVEAVGTVADELRERLAGAEHDARVAAAEAGERVASDGGWDEIDEELQAEQRALAETAEVAEELAVEAAALEEAAPAGEPSEEALALELAVDEGLAGELAVDEGLAGELAVSGQGEADDEGSSRRSVDELFAMIRAGRAPAEAPSYDEAGASPIDPDRTALARRSEVLSPIEARLARVVKRALQDDQNELLDAIRHASGAPELDVLLPEEQQRRRFEAAVSGALGEAWAAGRGSLRADGETGGEEDDDGVVGDAGSALAAQLAEELAGRLRDRLSSSLSGVADAAEAATQELASAAYRDWKGGRIESLAGDFATRAFAVGAVSAAAGVSVRWVVDDDGQACPDCDDNALAGPQPVGEPFPTGQAYPPVHPGCRCLLVAADS